VNSGALVLIDMQKDVLYGRPQLRSLVVEARVVENCVAAAAHARNIGMRVVYVKVLRRADGADSVVNDTDVETKLRERGISPPLTCVEGAEGADLVGGLTVDPADLIVVKRRRSAFNGTELDWLLRRLGISTLVLGGVATNWGVESTLRDAYDLGYKLRVIPECCCGFSTEDHEWAVRRIFPNMSRIVSLAAFCAAGSGDQ
jgi:nicotinamidase-related amidase